MNLTWGKKLRNVSEMIVSIHQPNYLPYLGFFDKVKNSDILIIHDDCQVNFKDFQQRNKIRIEKGWKWLTVPVYKELRPIMDIKIKNEITKNGPHWSKKHYQEINANYAKTPYFKSFRDELKEIYDKDYEKLEGLNMALITFLLKAFDIETKIVFSKNFGFDSKGTKKIIDLVNAVDGDIYISGVGGRNYLDLSMISNFKVIFQNFKHPIYPQRYSGFEPNMAAIDALFNVGKLPS